MSPQTLPHSWLSLLLLGVILAGSALPSLPGQGVCTGQVSAPSAVLPYGQGVAHPEVNPAALARDPVLHSVPGSTYIAFTPCGGAPGSAVAVNMGPCFAAGAVNAGWPPSALDSSGGAPVATAGGPFAAPPVPSGLAGVCGGLVDYPPAAAPIASAGTLQTEIGPTALSLVSPGVPPICRQTTGRILGAAVTQQPGISETVVFTDRPSIEVLVAGTITPVALPGTMMACGWVQQQGSLTASLAITDTSVAILSGGQLQTWPLPPGALPVSAAVIGSCAGGTGTAVTLAVETSLSSLFLLAGGTAAHVGFPAPIVARPVAFTSGAVSGVLVFTATQYHILQGGVLSTYALNGTFVSYTIVPEGVAVTTTGGTNCYPAAGTIRGVVTTKVGSITEVVMFTDAPSLDVIVAGAVYSLPVPGMKMMAGGCFGFAGLLWAQAWSVGITDNSVVFASGGSVASTSWSSSQRPLTAGGVATCIPGGETMTVGVEISPPGFVAFDGATSSHHSLPGPAVMAPYSYSNGLSSGFIVLTSNHYHIISGGTKTSTALPGTVISAVPNFLGMLVTTTGTPSTTQITPTLGVVLMPFGPCDGSVNAFLPFNIPGMCPAAAGVSAGWPSAGLHVESGGVPGPPSASSIPGGSWLGFTMSVASTDSTDYVFALQNLPSGATHGLTAFSTIPAPGSPGSGPLLGLQQSPETIPAILIALSLPPTPGNPLHWPVGVPGVFPSAPFVIPGAAVAALAGQTWEFLAVGLDPLLNLVGHTNVARLTW